MSGAPPQDRIAVGIVVERRKARSPWTDFIWRPTDVLSGVPETPPWTVLAREDDRTSFYLGPGEIALYRTEAENYRRNLESGAPMIWVALEATGDEPPCRLVGITADPAEGEAFTEAGQAIVEAVAMGAPVLEAVAAFVAQCPAPAPFEKRQRDRANPEALARRGPGSGSRS